MQPMQDSTQFNSEPPASSAAGAIIAFFAGIILLTALIAGMIANWKGFISTSANLVQVLLWVVGILFSFALIGFALQRGYIGWVQAQHAKEDLKFKQEERQRAQQKHEMEMYLAESRLHADPLGNRPFIYDRGTRTVTEVASGNYQQLVPAHYAPHIHYQNDVQGLPPGQTDRDVQAQQPALETIITELVPNALEFVFGLDPLTNQLVKTALPKAVHIQLMGASGQGKSRQATSILTQLCARNDTEHLQLALIDCEGETTAPFQELPHVAYRADEPREAARVFRGLVKELERRDVAHLAMPVLLIFVEEFLNLRRVMPVDYREQALEDYTTLALRGRKRGMFLFSIGQTAYTEKAIRDAQNQFLSSMAFAVKPTAARSAGFTNTELLNKLYAERQPGQFLLERPAGDAILLAPYVDTRSVPGFLQSETSVESSLVQQSLESQQQATNNQSRNQLEPALQAKLEQVRNLIASGTVNKADIIQVVWGVRPGSSEKYRLAESEFKHIMACIAAGQ